MKNAPFNLRLQKLSLWVVISSVSFFVGCSTPTTPPSVAQSNWTIFPSEFYFLKNGTPLYEGNFHTNLWKDHRIYSVNPLRYYEFDDSFKLVFDSVLLFDHTNTGQGPVISGILSMCFNADKTQILCVKTNKWYGGNLQEINLASLSIKELLDTSNNVAMARYISDDTIVYYSYGSYSASNTNPPDAGYYLFVRGNGSKELLLQYISSLGPGELRNGFDIHPDHSCLIIPSVCYNRAPIVFEFNLRTRKQDTLPLIFNTSYNRWCLFLRYNHDGSKILYSSYPRNSFGETGYDDSEVGIIDKATFVKTVLGTDPYPQYASAICLFPEWSPDEKSIVYGSNPISNDGFLSTSYRPTILKSIY